MLEMMDLAGKRTLVVVAHPDDEVIGCGATISRLVREGGVVRVLLPLIGSTEFGNGTWDKRVLEFHRSCQALGCEPVIPSGALDEFAAGQEINKLHDLILPHVIWSDVVLTHWKGDLHQAHVAVSTAVELATRPFRRRKHVLMFEVPSSTDQCYFGSFVKNMYVLVDEHDIDRKLSAMRAYEEQYAPGRRPEDLLAHACRRGAEIGAPAAECFWIGRSFY
jgi:LmbE family N-acetylglucosaminyl deacetylase